MSEGNLGCPLENCPLEEMVEETIALLKGRTSTGGKHTIFQVVIAEVDEDGAIGHVSSGGTTNVHARLLLSGCALSMAHEDAQEEAADQAREAEELKREKEFPN